MDIKNLEFAQFTNRAEALAETTIKRWRYILPTLGRLFLISTFIEDGLRMWFQWGRQRDFMAYYWGAPMFVGALFVIFNLLTQLIGSSMVLLRSNVRIACGILLSTVLVQTCAYRVMWSANYFLRALSLIGGLALLFAETSEQGRKSMFAGVPSLDTRGSHVNYIQLFGRVTLVFMFVTVQRWELSPLYMLEAAIACSLMFAVTIGWKTKLSASALAAYLFLMNIFINSFWMMNTYSSRRDVAKYDFFQTFSIIGGLLLLISLGPGRVSVDHSKRNL